MNDADQKRLQAMVDLLDTFAGLAMQARLTAAWTHPSPTMTSYEKARNDKPPNQGEFGFHDYLTEEAYLQAASMLRRKLALEKARNADEVGSDE